MKRNIKKATQKERMLRKLEERRAARAKAEAELASKQKPEKTPRFNNANPSDNKTNNKKKKRRRRKGNKRIKK